jgi:cytidylate kinase
MLAIGSYEKCKQYINLHSSDSKIKKEIFPCITISRQTGSGSYEISQKLISLLQTRSKNSDNPWTYFNKELLNKLIEEFQLPKAFTSYITEDKYSHISDAVNELLGVKPSEWTIVHKTTEIILQLAKYGKTIIVGRGSALITSKLPNCFHIRLVAPLDNRLKHVQEVFNYARPKAIEYINNEDENRKKYLKSHFFREPDDATIYHLIINTGKLSYLEVADVIAQAVIKKYSESFN